MRLAVSNIAWTAAEDDDVHRAIARSGVDAIEIAPTRFWADPASVLPNEAMQAASQLADVGLEVVSFQSLLFARPDLVVFDDGRRPELVDYLSRIAALAGTMGAKRLVFGSPKSRTVPVGMSPEEAFDVAIGFFQEAGSAAADSGTVLCIEPNPPIYGCNFVTTAAEGIALVKAVNSPGFGLHLDAAGLVLAGEDPAVAAVTSGAAVKHVHASAPYLQELEANEVDHDAFASALRAIAYDGVVAIEMRAGEVGGNARRVVEAIETASAYRF